ncbi:avidin-like [Mustelus asterias]
MWLRFLQLAVALSLCLTNTAQAMSLSGCWDNDLGSNMTMIVSDSGVISGAYWSKVSSTGQMAKGVMIGYQQDLKRPTFGFVVKWKIDSITVWTGQYEKIAAKEHLKTVWLLRQNVNASDNWKATSIGMDLFTRRYAECELTDIWSEPGDVELEAGSTTETSGSERD